MMKKIMIILVGLLSCSTRRLPSNSSYILMDINSKRVLYGSNIHERFLTASIAKCLTAYVAICEGDLSDEVKMSYEASVEEGSKAYIPVGQIVTLEDLLYGLMLRSGNDCAYEIAYMIGGGLEGFSFLMNEYAKVIGMNNSTFENPSGLDSASYNYSTAYDMALLISECYKNETFMKIFGTKKYVKDNLVFYNKHKLVNLNDIYNGGKTGYTKKSGRTLITTAHNNLDLVCVTFNDSNDWNTHKYYLSKGSLYKNTLIMEKGVLENPFMKLDFLPYLKDDIYLPLLPNESYDIKIMINKNYHKDIGMVIVVIDDSSISFKLERYYVDG